jgi:hypothetical protein
MADEKCLIYKNIVALFQTNRTHHRMLMILSSLLICFFKFYTGTTVLKSEAQDLPLSRLSLALLNLPHPAGPTVLHYEFP